MGAVRACKVVAGGVQLTVKVSPGASRDRIAGVMADGAIKVQVRAAPERGKANEAVIALLADWLGIGRGQITILRGQTSSRKVILLAGVNPEAIRLD